MLPNITSLRFLLAILVVIFHLAEFSKKQGLPYYNELAVFHRGVEAVYVFFSLSGFLIIRQLYLEKSATGTISLRNFFGRRMKRILPLYCIILCFGLIYYNIILPKMGYPIENNYTLAEALVLCVFFMPNVFSHLYQPGGIIDILWSIGIEEQFYLFIAPLLSLLPIKRTIPFLILLTIIYFTAFCSEEFHWLQSFRMYFYYFSAAGIISILSIKYPDFFKNSSIRNTILVVFIAYFATTIFQQHLSMELYQLFSMVLFSLTIGFLAANPISLLNNKSFIYLGKISYGIYMYHIIVVQLLAFIFIKTNFIPQFPTTVFVLLYNCIAVGLTIYISHLSYTYLESYFIRPKKMPK